jgi:hypothetical protein
MRFGEEEPYEKGVIWSVDTSSPLPGTKPSTPEDAVYFPLGTLYQDLQYIRDTIFPGEAKLPTQSSNPWYLWMAINDMFSVLDGLKSPFEGQIEFTRLREVRAEYMIWNQETDANLDKGDLRSSYQELLNDGTSAKYLNVFFDIIAVVNPKLSIEEVMEKAMDVNQKWNGLNGILDQARVEDERQRAENEKKYKKQGEDYWAFVSGGANFDV